MIITRYKGNRVMNYVKDILIAIAFCAVGAVLYNLFCNQKEFAKHFATYGIMVKHMNAGVAADNGTIGPDALRAAQEIKNSVNPWLYAQEKARDTVVQVIAQTAEINILEPYRTPKQTMHAGSAFFIKIDGYPEGLLVTNAHVVEEAYAIWIKIPSLGRVIIDVEIIGRSPERDLALLKVSEEGLEKIKEAMGSIPYLVLGNSDCVRRTDEVLTLGYPLGQSSLKSTSGVVSGREHVGSRLLIQIDSPINPGNSGGPALNIKGEVIGVTCSGVVTAQNVGYIIPINELKLIFADLYKTPLLRKPFLGFFLNSGSKELALHFNNPVPSGCYLIDVFEKSPIAKVGIKTGDMIYEINGISVDEYGELALSWTEDKISLSDYISMIEIGQTINIVFYRNGTRHEVNFIFEPTELPPVKHVFPGIDYLDYEIFGGMLFQPLNLNIVSVLVNNAPILTRYGLAKHQKDPALIITHIVPNSQTQRLNILAEGTIISEIDGKVVKTMDDLRRVLFQALDKERITFKTEEGIFFVLNVKKVLEDELKLSQAYQYPISPFMKELINRKLPVQDSHALIKPALPKLFNFSNQ